MVLPILHFYLELARRGFCQAALSRACKPQVGGSIPLANSNLSGGFSRFLNVLSLSETTITAHQKSDMPSYRQRVHEYIRACEAPA